MLWYSDGKQLVVSVVVSINALHSDYLIYHATLGGRSVDTVFISPVIHNIKISEIIYTHLHGLGRDLILYISGFRV